MDCRIVLIEGIIQHLLAFISMEKSFHLLGLSASVGLNCRAELRPRLRVVGLSFATRCTRSTHHQEASRLRYTG